MRVVVYWDTVCGNRSENHAFWDSLLSVDTGRPRLTACFENCVLIAAPCLLFLLSSPLYVRHLHRKHNQHQPRSASTLNHAKLIVSFLLALVCFTNLICACVHGFEGLRAAGSPSEFIANIILFITAVVAGFTMRLEYQRGMHTSAVFSLFWTLMMFTFTLVTASEINGLIIQDSKDTIRASLLMLATSLVFVQFVMQFFADNKGRESQKVNDTEMSPLIAQPAEDVTTATQNNETIHPESHISFISRVICFWSLQNIRKGSRENLNMNDIDHLNFDLSSEPISMNFDAEWNEEMENRNRESGAVVRHRGLLGVLLRLVWSPLLLSFLALVTTQMMEFASPLLLRLLIRYFNNPNSFLWQGVLISVSFYICNCLSGVLYYHGYCRLALLIGFKLRTMLMPAIYKKALRLSNNSRKKVTFGEMMNMLSMESYKILETPIFGLFVFVTPIVVAVAMTMLYQTIGLASLAGLLALLLLVPANTLLGGMIVHRLQKKQLVYKDIRLKFLDELLSGIQVIKLSAWERAFEARVNTQRNKEATFLKNSSIVLCVGAATWFLLPYLVSLVVFAAYVYISPEATLDADIAFTTLVLISICVFPINFFTSSLSYMIQSAVALSRIERFLLMEERDVDVGTKTPPNVALSITDASFSWEDDEMPILQRIVLSVERGELVAIVGSVGSGKSSLLSSVLGEINRISGSVDIQGSLALVPQKAWIQHASLRDNILFGSPFDQRLYDNVIDACSLRPDLKILPGGDMTEIGDKGVNLSGGQKQRVSLARALYQGRDVYLLDDTLSAVDVHVARQIFDAAIGHNGFLAGKTRVLVTHGVNFLPKMDRIAVLSNGRVSETGTFDELLIKNGAFSEFIRTYLSQEGSEAETDPEVLESIQERITSMSESYESQTDVEYDVRKKKSRSIRTTKRHAICLLKHQHNIPDETSGPADISAVCHYVKYGGYLIFLAVAVMFVLLNVSQIAANMWLTDWTNDATRNVTSPATTSYRLQVYGYIGIAQVSLAMLSVCLLAVALHRATNNLFKSALNRVLRSPITFFDTTPIGRILNRLSKDVDVLDTQLPAQLCTIILMSVVLANAIIANTYTSPYFLTVAVPFFAVFLFLYRFIMRSLVQMKSLETISLSPVYGHFEETLQGHQVIKAFGKEDAFIKKFYRLLDNTNRVYYAFRGTTRFTYINLNMFMALLIFMAAFIVVMQKDVVSASVAGLAVSYALQAVSRMKTCIHYAIELESYLVSVERINAYTELEPEASWDEGEVSPPPNWPQKGQLEFRNYSTRYRPGLNPVIRQISCRINAGEKIGIVGRTGAGKSSLTLALFRLIEPSGGQIVIDGIDISRIALYDLRKQLTIIPQEPVLFSGTLRENLDPLSLHSEEELLQSVEYAHLTGLLQTLKEGLDYDLDSFGETLSVGERQLVCLARAVLKKTRILILDEASAAVDLQTDDLIQNTIRTCFRDCTIITIAHRISTIMDYDRVLVLENGTIKEFGRPGELLTNRKSAFHGLAREAGLA